MIFFFFLVALEFEVRALHLLGRCSTTLSNTAQPYIINFFKKIYIFLCFIEVQLTNKSG
jgi:hypothetical protein